jgi:hypothetical protein
MILIAHRGNISGSNPKTENSIKQINYCLSLGLNVEIDVWNIDNQWFLGHDEPQYLIDTEFLENPKLWCHAKNYLALHNMIINSNIHCFWHDTDKYTITSRGIIWSYPCEEIINTSVCVLPERCHYDIMGINQYYGICTDYIEKFI